MASYQFRCVNLDTGGEEIRTTTESRTRGGNGNVDTGATNWQTDSWWLLEMAGLLASVSQTFQHCRRLIRDFPYSVIVHFQISLEYYRSEAQSLYGELRKELREKETRANVSQTRERLHAEGKRCQ